MWNAKDFFQEAIIEDTMIGYVFKCPKCGEVLDMIFRTVPFSKEFVKECIDKYKYDPNDSVWESAGSLHTNNLSLHPSIVHLDCDKGGHYWIINGTISNC